jgi:hypothetical protein
VAGSVSGEVAGSVPGEGSYRNASSALTYTFLLRRKIELIK